MLPKIIIFIIILVLLGKVPAPRSSKGKEPQQSSAEREKEILRENNKFLIIKKFDHDFFQMQQERMAHLLETGKSSDVQFLVGKEGTAPKLFLAHTFVLGIGTETSEKFKGQFRMNKWTDWPRDEPIKVTDVDPNVFEAMLHYLYLGELAKVTAENIANVLDTAKKYLLPTMFERCIHLAITEMLNMENVVELLHVAKTYEEMVLADHCLAFIDKNIAEFIETDEFLALDQKYIAEIFSRNTIDSDELTLFQALDRWAHNQCLLNQNIERPTGRQKREAMGPALKTIRFPLLSLADLKDKIWPTGILDEETLNILLNNFKHENAKAYLALPFSFEERKIPRNNKFNGQHCSSKLSLSRNGLVLTHSGSTNINDYGLNLNEWASSASISARAILPVPQFNEGAKNGYIAAYFEVQILNESRHSIRLGFCDDEFRMEGDSLGNHPNSFGIWSQGEMHIESAHIKFGRGEFNSGDVIGIGLLHSPEHSSLICFATCNGTRIGAYQLSPKFIEMQLFPVVTLHLKGDSIKANFGKEEWLYNPHQLLKLKVQS